MSYDPYDNTSDTPRRDDRYEYDRPRLDDPDRIKARLQAPAICLIVVGILNLLVSLVQVGGTVIIAVQSPQEVQKSQQVFMKFLPPEMREEMAKEQQGKSPEAEKVQSIIINTLLSVAMVLVALLSVAGGARMLVMKSYGLCIAGAVSAALPCISCSGCCGFGEGIGIWALVVLLNPDVKSAFQ